jgi:hypothetical protein
MRVGEAAPAEVRHRVGLAPDHVVQDPEAEVLHRHSEAEDVVVGANHPDRAVLAQHAAAFDQPFAREGIVGREIGELVPLVVDAIHQAVIRPPQRALELQVVGRVGEDRMHRGRRQPLQRGDAVAHQHLVQRQVEPRPHTRPRESRLHNALRRVAPSTQMVGPTSEVDS